jgi:perosamine synthetase
VCLIVSTKNLNINKEDSMSIQNPRFCGAELAYVQEVLELGFKASSEGTMKERFERAFAKRFGVAHAISSNSGTSPIHQALVALGASEGDEIILSPLSPVMPAYAVIQAGATPVFADVDPNTFLIDPADIARKITKKTRGILCVHLYGAVCDMPAIMGLAKEHDLYVIEDSAQCFFGKDSLGRLAGTIGIAGTFSFDNMKHLSTGEGGMLITNHWVTAERARQFGGLGFKNITAETGNVRRDRDDFQNPAYERHGAFGFNYRMAEVVAAVGLGQLERATTLCMFRRHMGARFMDVLADLNCDWLVPQQTYPKSEHSYWTFAARYDGEEKRGVLWEDFRKKFMEFGGDGIYAAWQLIYEEPSMIRLNQAGQLFPNGGPKFPHVVGMFDGVSYPNAEYLQARMLQFTTNQLTNEEQEVQAEALRRTIRYFK